MPKSSLGQRHFSGEDQLRFAAISGDHNPMHVDPVYARRTQFGRQVVHGMHVLSWGLDRYFAALDAPRPTRLKVSFSKPTFVGEVVDLYKDDSVRGEHNLAVVAAGSTVATITVVFAPPVDPLPAFSHPRAGVAPDRPRELGLADIEGLAGSIGVQDGAFDAAQWFPAAARALGSATVSALLGTSRIVGMECPGLHSIFAGLRVDIGETWRSDDLSWHVFRIDPRFRRIDLDVCGGGIVGRLETFLRIPPARQPSMGDISAIVGHDEFAGQRALVVGGSRGLGEATAKIIAAGGGTPIITFAVGQDDAARVAAEIVATGRECELIRYDATRPAEPQLAALRHDPTSFYYFATCSIFRRKAALYEAALMEEFLRFFVDGFYNLCSALRERRPGKLVGFYPSTIAIDSPLRDLTEYCLAKLAGEHLCQQLHRYLPELDIVVERLPRVETDQTATLLPVHSESAFGVMLPLARRVQAATVPATNREPESEGSRSIARSTEVSRRS